MKKEKLTTKELKEIKLLKEKKNQDFLKRFILDETESKVKDRFSDKELDRESEKQKLINDTINNFWRVEELQINILKKPTDYKTIFTQDYYKEIYRLNNWKYEGNISNKPWIVGRYTNEIIYFRFSSEVLPFLRIINPFVIPGKRKFKHHQYLTPGARIELSKFISQATDLMKECSDWYEFRTKYYNCFGVPYQIKLF